MAARASPFFYDMATRPEEERGKMQEIYVQKRLAGCDPAEAKRLAGYAEYTKPADIERPGGPVWRIIESLKQKGIDENFLATEYKEGLEKSKSGNAREMDLNAHAQYLRQLGWLMGYGNRNPMVAIQVNNRSGIPESNDPGRIRELMQQVTDLLEGVKKELCDRGLADVREGSPENPDAEALDGMVDAGADTQETSGGGEP